MHCSLISQFIVMRFRLRQYFMKLLHSNLKAPLAHTLVYVGILLRIIGSKKFGLNMILMGRRIGNVSVATTIIRSMVYSNDKDKCELNKLLPRRIDKQISKYATRILILKLPRLAKEKISEKGVIIFKFTETFIPLYLALDVHLLTKYFRIVLEPSWAGYSIVDILIWSQVSHEKVVVLTPDAGDYEFLTELSSNLIPDNLGAADWVNPEKFYKIKDEVKLYDAIYIANYNPAKRVDRFIRAIVRINRKNKNFKAVLVCAGHGYTGREIMATLNCAKNKANISYFEGKSQSELNLLLNQSKVNVLLSLKEGANKVLTEGLFSGTAALLLKENVGVKRSSINSHTGKIVHDTELEDTLIWFSQHYDEFSPDEWAISHISPAVSTQNLSTKLREIELSEGRQWRTDLFTKVNQPELAYLDSELNLLLTKRAELLENFRKGANDNNIIKFIESL